MLLIFEEFVNAAKTDFNSGFVPAYNIDAGGLRWSARP
jgi:hypothetical protein